MTALTVQCEDVRYRGTVVGREVDHISVVPIFDETGGTTCTGGALGKATITNVGCTYTFDSDTFENTTHFSAGQTHAAVSLACGLNGSVKIVAGGCTITLETTHSGEVKVNHDLPGIRYDELEEQITTPNGSTDTVSALTVTATVKTIKATTSGANCVLVGLGNPGTHINGTYEGKGSLTGYLDSEGTTKDPHANSFSEGSTVDVGLTLPAASAQHSFTSDSPTGKTVLTGATAPGTKEVFTLTSISFACEGITYRGTIEGAQVDHVSVAPVFTEAVCPAGAFGNLLVQNNGCTYTLDSDTFENATHFAAGVTHANLSLSCGHAGSIVMAFSGCVMTLSTTHSGGVIVNHNLPGSRVTALPSHSGGKSAISVESTLTTMRWTTSGTNCVLVGLGNPGTHSHGSLEGRSIITGYEDNEGSKKDPHFESLSEGALVNVGLTTP